MPYADRIRSYSKPGEALILFQVRDSSPPKEMPQIWYTVRKKLGDMRGTLPPGVVGPFFNDEFGDVYGSIYALSADGFSYAELKDHADQVRQRLLKVQGRQQGRDLRRPGREGLRRDLARRGWRRSAST